ncbi:hypothetical protein BDV18DRAFT_162911 [Aspergillus unguis]
MIHSTTAVFLLAPILSALAQDLSTDIVGCTEVDCPNNGDDICNLADESFAGIGLARIADVPDSLDGISLVKGVHVEGSGDTDGDTDNGAEKSRPFRSVYYLGTPSGLDVNDLSGCAVVFNDPPTGHFDQPRINDTVDVDPRAAYGTCPDVIKQSCIDKLTEQASNVRLNGSSCSALESNLKNNTPDECSDLTGRGDGLGSFDVVSLGNLSTISGSANSSSECWPVLPKSDNLAQLSVDTTMGNYTDQGNIAEMYKITPILTVFTGGDGGLVNDTSAYLTCLKVVTTKNTDNTTDTPVDAAPLARGSMMGVSMAALATLMFVFL